MDKFTLVSLNKDKTILRESIDMYGLVTKSFDFKSDISSVCESMDVLNDNGFRVIVEGEISFIYSNGMVLQEGLKELYVKFKEKFGGTKDEFEDWYQERMVESQEDDKADNVSKARKVLSATKGYIKKIFSQDHEMYRKLMSELIADYEATVGEQFRTRDAFESKESK